MLSFLKDILQLLLNPRHGWEEISVQAQEPEILAARGMYPLMGLAALSAFVQGAYWRGFDLGAVLQLAIAQFVSLMAAYFISVALFDTFASRFSKSEVSANKSRTVSLYIISLLCIIQIIENLVPVALTIVQFLPAFAAIVLWKATSYLKINPEKEGGFIVFAIGALIIPWFVIKTLLTFVL